MRDDYESESMDPKLLAGTLDLLILESLVEGRSYGYAIAQHVRRISEERILLKEGSLYPALHKLERAGALKADWGEEGGRRRKYYRLTAAGKKALQAKRSMWANFSGGMNKVLGLES